MIKLNQRGDIETVGAVFIGLFVLVAFGGAIAFGIVKNTNHHPVTFTVNKTERIVDRGGKDAKYMIYTDKGVYQNTDSVLNGKFNSADLYNQIQVGKTYNCDVVGYRNGVMSMFENVTRCEEVKK